MLLASLAASSIILLSYGVAFAVPSYVYPLMGPRVSSEYGWRNHPVFHVVKHHEGIDLAAPEGAPIRSIQAGRIVFADPYGGYGNLVVVQHAGGMTSHYGHCRSIRVRPGQLVQAGEIVGTVGSTGRVTGPHLHFEIRLRGEVENPERYLPGLALMAEG
ncbi:MAG: M23 family metallopeptidase [Oligoflexia bacterium]|nr:M23 family metallopeptidase [Oligoflexia bacterium]